MCKSPHHFLVVQMVDLSVTAAHFLPFILGPDPSATLGTALDPLTSAPCNVHLVVMILDRVMVSLFPELLGSTAIG